MDTTYAYALEVGAHTGSEVTTLYFSTTPAIVTSAGSTPASTTMIARLVQPGNYQASWMPSGNEYSQSTIGFGEVVLDNHDGTLDYLMNYAFDGRTSILRRIDAALLSGSTYPSSWTTVFTGTLFSIRAENPGYNQGTLIIQWRDQMADLDVPLPINVFAGDNSLPNGLEGVADDLKNRYKPLVLGKIYNFTPVCVNTSKLVYAVSPPTGGLLDLITAWDSISNFDAVTDFFGASIAGQSIGGVACRSGIDNVTVYDSGVVIAQGAAYTDENDMMTNAPTAGQCRVCKASGYIRFGSTPAGTVTVSCTDASGVAHTVGSLMRSILVDYMRWDASRYSNSDSTTLDTSCTLTMGIAYSEGSTTVSEIMNQIARSAGVCYYFTTAGVFRAFRVTDPADQTATLTITDDFIRSASISNTGIPAKAIRLKQQRNYTVQSLQTAATLEHKNWVSLEWRENLVSNLATATKHLLSKEMIVETCIAEDAVSEATRLLNLYSTRRDILSVSLLSDFFDFTTLSLGQIAQVDLTGRFGYVTKKMMVVGVAYDIKNNKIELELWG